MSDVYNQFKNYSDERRGDDDKRFLEFFKPQQNSDGRQGNHCPIANNGKCQHDVYQNISQCHGSRL